MKRELKFKRVFQHSETGRICITTWGNLDHKDNSCDDFSSFKSPSQISGYYPVADLQFTGLKDKNGKEIYEGDIIKEMEEDWSFTDEWDIKDARWNDDSLFNPMPMKEIQRDVVTMEHFPTFWLKNEGFGYEGEGLVEAAKCEVIGNLYENPELLKT